jgi:hypothetical protein
LIGGAVVHTILVALHAVAGVVAFGAGALALQTRTQGTWRFPVYRWSLVVMAAAVAAAVAANWVRFDAAARIVFGGLLVLAGYMLWRAWQAGRRLREQGTGWRPRYVDDVGFTLVSLFAGFVIVGAIDLGAPGWLVGLIAAAGIAGGILALRQVKSRLDPAI